MLTPQGPPLPHAGPPPHAPLPGPPARQWPPRLEGPPPRPRGPLAARPARRPAGAQVTLASGVRPDAAVLGHPGERAGQLLARADVELGEHLLQVVLDRARADEELGADLRVRLPVARHARDLCLLGREEVSRLDRHLAHGFARGCQLAPGALRERFGADSAEVVVGGAELLARVDAAVLARQPFAVEGPGAGEVDHPPAALEPLDRLAVERLGACFVAQQRARAGLDAERP